MKKVKVYQYPNCSTCKKAILFLKENNIAAQIINIVESPPTKSELNQMLECYDGDIKKLFNTSGMLYREMDIKAKLPKLSTDQAIGLLAKHGKLIKRPFLLAGKAGRVGFRAAEWADLL